MTALAIPTISWLMRTAKPSSSVAPQLHQQMSHHPVELCVAVSLNGMKKWRSKSHDHYWVKIASSAIENIKIALCKDFNLSKAISRHCAYLVHKELFKSECIRPNAEATTVWLLHMVQKFTFAPPVKVLHILY